MNYLKHFENCPHVNRNCVTYFVLVELLEVISGHVWDTLGFGFVVVSGITNNANLLLWSWDVWQSK